MLYGSSDAAVPPWYPRLPPISTSITPSHLHTQRLRPISAPTVGSTPSQHPPQPPSPSSHPAEPPTPLPPPPHHSPPRTQGLTALSPPALCVPPSLPTTQLLLQQEQLWLIIAPAINWCLQDCEGSGDAPYPYGGTRAGMGTEQCRDAGEGAAIQTPTPYRSLLSPTAAPQAHWGQRCQSRKAESIISSHRRHSASRSPAGCLHLRWMLSAAPRLHAERCCTHAARVHV